MNFRNIVVAPLKDYFRIKFTFENAYFSNDGNSWKEKLCSASRRISGMLLRMFLFFARSFDT